MDRNLDQLSERLLGRPTAPIDVPVPCDVRCLRAAGQALSAAPEGYEPALEAALAAVRSAAGADLLRLYLLDTEGLPRMRGGGSRWESLPFLALVLRLEAGVLMRVLHAGGPVLIRESFEIGEPAAMATTDRVHCLALPLKARGQPRGVLLLFKGDPFTQPVVEAMRQSSAGISIIVDYLALLADAEGPEETPQPS